MTIMKTVLEFRYQPADFFEAPYRRTTAAFEMLVDAGLIAVSLSSPQNPVPEMLRLQIKSEAEAIFLARQLLLHRKFHLDESARTIQHTADGIRAISLTLTDVVVETMADQVDIVLSDSTGNVIHDSKAERIAEDTRFVDELAPKISRSPLLQSLLNSYRAAVNDPANELVHLYEIRDALARYYGGEKQTCKRLGITRAEWQRLGRLADYEPVAQSRHRGGHLGSIRPATQAELEEARDTACRLILAFAASA